MNLILDIKNEDNKNKIIEFVNQLGIKFTQISDEELEEYFLSSAIKYGDKQEYINKEDFINSLGN